MAHTEAVNLRVYWITWAILLAITVMMLVLDAADIGRGALVAIMLGAMAVKATLIAGNFMHLRHERAGIVLTLVVGLFVFGIVLYALIAPDAARIHEMVNRR
jgi:cytochrome c oxidase subunit IV